MSNKMSKYFGTDGFRGKVNEDLSAFHAYLIGRYIGHVFGREKPCSAVIGKDTRKSCYMYECALAAGLAASGADAYLMHVTTTPSVSHIVRSEQFDCGIMISASHNPYDDNGIKLLNSQGEKMEDSFIEGLESYLDLMRDDLPLAVRDKVGKVVDFAAGRNRYIGYLITLARHSFKDMRVGLDCANGSAWMIAKSVFDALGAKTYVINNEPNGLNINRDCGSTHMEGLQALVREKKLNIGFAFDGDADRCLAVDENGEIVDGDQILYLYGSYMKQRGNLKGDTLVATVMSNLGLFKALEKKGIACVKTAVGDRFVSECMRENGYLLGGEQSGHIIFAKYASTGDGVLTAIKVMQAMLDQKKSLSQLLAGFVRYPQVLKNIVVNDKDLVMQDEGVKETIRELEQKLGNNGRILLRKSGTEPVLRVMAEAATQADCENAVDTIIERIKQGGMLVEVRK